MCGIAGALAPDGRHDEQALHQLGSAMGAAIAHRGPDDAGIWIPLTRMGKAMDEYQFLEKRLSVEPYSIGLRKDDQKLADAINGALAEMHKNGTYDRLQKQYFSFDIYH